MVTRCGLNARRNASRRCRCRGSGSMRAVDNGRAAYLAAEEGKKVVRAQRPSVGEGDNRAFAPILVIDLRAVLCLDRGHRSLLDVSMLPARIRSMGLIETKPIPAEAYSL